MSRQLESRNRKAIQQNLASDLRSINVQARIEQQPSLDDYIASKIREHQIKSLRARAQNGLYDEEQQPGERVEASKDEVRSPLVAQDDELFANYGTSSNPHSMDGQFGYGQDEDAHHAQEADEIRQDSARDEHSFGDAALDIYRQTDRFEQGKL